MSYYVQEEGLFSNLATLHFALVNQMLQRVDSIGKP